MLPVVALAGTGIALAYSYIRGPTTVPVKINGKVVRVQNLPDKHEAARLLLKIRQNLERLVETCKECHEPEYKRLVDRFNPDRFEENDLTADSTSYSENKGEKIVVCLRDKTQRPYPLVDENTIMFVMIHECAHLMTESTGHTPEFWTNFRKLLQDSIKLGLYIPTNYAKCPVEYCGMTISDSPL
jgi:hypothetical protein